ncbi:hypothetical protein Tco_1528984, partial [Tanacetum coccineum]
MFIASQNQMLKELEILSTNQRGGGVRASLDCKVVKVLVYEGMKVEKDQPIFVVAVYPKQRYPYHKSECEKSRFKKCLDEEQFSRPNSKFPIEDVMPCIFPIHALLPYQKNAGNSPMEPTFDSTVDLLKAMIISRSLTLSRTIQIIFLQHIIFLLNMV